MYPTRAAPLPPKGASLPPNHPFLTYYLPPQHQNHSVSSFATSPAPSSPSASSVSSSHRAESPSASLAAPLSPHRANTYPTPSQPRSYLPADLAIFDQKSRHTLLDDLEFITGKRLSFPFINNLIKSKAERKEKGEERVKRVLKKERDPTWEEDFAWDGVRLLREEKDKAVKRGSWV